MLNFLAVKIWTFDSSSPGLEECHRCMTFCSITLQSQRNNNAIPTTYTWISTIYLPKYAVWLPLSSCPQRFTDMQLHCSMDFHSYLLTVWSTLLSKSSHHVDETAVIFDAFARTSSWLLSLLLWSDLWSLSTHLSGTSEGSVYFSCNSLPLPNTLELYISVTPFSNTVKRLERSNCVVLNPGRQPQLVSPLLHWISPQ